MKNYELIEDKLYKSIYNVPKIGNAIDIWNEIKDNKDILYWAISCNDNSVNGLTICQCILLDYKNVCKNVYYQLINLIYSNKDVARSVVGQQDNNYSCLMMSLWNPKLRLNEDQKEFAVEEAINGDDEFSYNAYDIKYWILRNPNWSLTEKQKLINDFWYDEKEYSEMLEEWEWNIINENSKYFLNKDRFIVTNHINAYDELSKIFGMTKTSNDVLDEIDFCKKMHELRPPEYESNPKKFVMQK